MSSILGKLFGWWCLYVAFRDRHKRTTYERIFDELREELGYEPGPFIKNMVEVMAFELDRINIELAAYPITYYQQTIKVSDDVDATAIRWGLSRAPGETDANLRDRVRWAASDHV